MGLVGCAQIGKTCWVCTILRYRLYIHNAIWPKSFINMHVGVAMEAHPTRFVTAQLPASLPGFLPLETVSGIGYLPCLRPAVRAGEQMSPFLSSFVFSADLLQDVAVFY